MLLGIDADLSAPPSSPTTFREVCLFAKAYRGYDVVALSPEEYVDSYSRWMAIYGLWDYVDDLLPLGQLRYLDIHIEGGGRLTQFNLREVLSLL